MAFWNTLTGIGVEYAHNPSDRRSVFLANAISVVLTAAGLLLFLIYYFWYGWSVITVAIPLISLFCLAPLLLNAWNLTGMSRIWVCVFVPVATLALSVYAKTIYYGQQEELDYFTFRIIMLSCCVFPPVFFAIKERSYLIGSSLAILIILMLHDPVHTFFGVPYQANTLKESNYAFSNVVILMVFVLMTGAVLFMKWVSEMNEQKAKTLIEQLNETNQELYEKNSEIELRNEEISKQSDDIRVSRHKLTDAYKIIEEQRNLLFAQNRTLSTELIEKNKELTETNNELIKHNNELRQFSFTVSHNLRGPVASLMGLMKLFHPEDLTPENQEIFQHLGASTQRLDNIIKDLSKIIDIRHDIFHIRQQINLEHEIAEILEVLGREIESNDISFSINLSRGAILYSVRPMVHSILYNLISNGIKYRSPDRNATITIESDEDEKFYFLKVTDNGLGIDLSRDKENLFKLYKRFHHHTEGKGLGLYLVKLQAEALGGSISVDSDVNRFTAFTVKLKKPENAERQILYHEPVAEIYFDARLNCIGTTWHRAVTPEEYQLVLKKILDFVRVYNTPNYISDFSAEGSGNNSEMESIFLGAIQEAAKQGLSRIGIVLPDSAKMDVKKGPDLFDGYGISFEAFTTIDEAFRWIEEQNKLSVPKISGNG